MLEKEREGGRKSNDDSPFIVARQRWGMGQRRHHAVARGPGGGSHDCEAVTAGWSTAGKSPAMTESGGWLTHAWLALNQGRQGR
jgi:hypothetical protein